jgi:hypothetical protein
VLRTAEWLPWYATRAKRDRRLVAPADVTLIVRVLVPETLACDTGRGRDGLPREDDAVLAPWAAIQHLRAPLPELRRAARLWCAEVRATEKAHARERERRARLADEHEIARRAYVAELTGGVRPRHHSLALAAADDFEAAVEGTIVRRLMGNGGALVWRAGPRRAWAVDAPGKRTLAARIAAHGVSASSALVKEEGADALRLVLALVHLRAARRYANAVGELYERPYPERRAPLNAMRTELRRAGRVLAALGPGPRAGVGVATFRAIEGGASGAADLLTTPIPEPEIERWQRVDLPDGAALDVPIYTPASIASIDAASARRSEGARRLHESMKTERVEAIGDALLAGLAAGDAPGGVAAVEALVTAAALRRLEWLAKDAGTNADAVTKLDQGALATLIARADREADDRRPKGGRPLSIALIAVEIATGLSPSMLADSLSATSVP